MNTSTLPIVASTVHGVPSGNYDGSSLDWPSDAVKAVSYYKGQGSFQTIVIQVTEFQGKIVIDGSLSSAADTTSWTELYTYDSSFSVLTDYHPETIVGNFVWVRARVIGFTQGTINQITITY